MSYARFFSYDVYVYADVSGGVTCMGCNFGDMMEARYNAESTQEMIDHLKAHQKIGDRIPEDIFDRLLEDDARNFPPKK